MKILEKYSIIGNKIFEILKFTKNIPIHIENEGEPNHFSDKLNYIEAIWEQFLSLNLLKIEYLQNIDSKKNIQNDVGFNIYYSISHESIKYLNQFYENCLNDCTNDNLRRFSRVIFILYKIFQLYTNFDIQQHIDLNEYKMLFFSVKNIFTSLNLRFDLIL